MISLFDTIPYLPWNLSNRLSGHRQNSCSRRFTASDILFGTSSIYVSRDEELVGLEEGIEVEEKLEELAGIGLE